MCSKGMRKLVTSIVGVFIATVDIGRGEIPFVVLSNLRVIEWMFAHPKI